MPGQSRPPILPAAIGVGGIGMMSQFNRDALWSIGLGLVSIVVPFTVGYVFFFLPFIGLYYGYRAIRRGSVIGGVVGIVLSVIGGIITILFRVVR
jgi:hypothetical protein